LNVRVLGGGTNAYSGGQGVKRCSSFTRRRTAGGCLEPLLELVGAVGGIFVLIVVVLTEIVRLVTGAGGPHVGRGGKPTDLGGATPIEMVSAIRDEFYALTKPVLLKFKRHRAYTRRSFGAGRYKEPEYWEPKVTSEARAFASRHSKIELEVALFPFLDDPTVGAEAAIVLSAVPFMVSDSRKTRGHISNPIKASGYKAPSDRGSWSLQAAEKVRCAVREDFWRWQGANSKVLTLEAAIVPLVDECKRDGVIPAASFADTHHDALSLSVYYLLAGYDGSGWAAVAFDRMVALRGGLQSATNEMPRADRVCVGAEGQGPLAQSVFVLEAARKDKVLAK
jgi:hypothetical protein